MSILAELTDHVKREGYTTVNAEAKVCQDIILKAISESCLNKNITIKGGVVMRSITGNSRRATVDVDLDFIHYSLTNESIHHFIELLNCIQGIAIRIDGEITELSQQEYHGKRVMVIIEDDTGYALHSKIDLSVHKQLHIIQDEFCFDICWDDEGACLLINSKEQIFAEKLRSLLRFGPFSTRYKDIFDLCYLSDFVDKERLQTCLNTYIYNDSGMRENNLAAILKRIHRTFEDRFYRKNIEKSLWNNWLEVTPDYAFRKITDFLTAL